ncbi:hypothetical protein TNCV_3663121 [Trichonephila clavipes]|nr:hypothetical protein TNCV_3663121 [Trichonephila clavipes]
MRVTFRMSLKEDSHVFKSAFQDRTVPSQTWSLEVGLFAALQEGTMSTIQTSPGSAGSTQMDVSGDTEKSTKGLLSFDFALRALKLM